MSCLRTWTPLCQFLRNYKRIPGKSVWFWLGNLYPAGERSSFWYFWGEGGTQKWLVCVFEYRCVNFWETINEFPENQCGFDWGIDMQISSWGAFIFLIFFWGGGQAKMACLRLWIPLCQFLRNYKRIRGKSVWFGLGNLYPAGEVHFFLIFSGGGGHAKMVCLRLWIPLCLFLRNYKRIPGKSAVLIVEFISSWGALFCFSIPFSLARKKMRFRAKNSAIRE